MRPDPSTWESWHCGFCRRITPSPSPVSQGAAVDENDDKTFYESDSEDKKEETKAYIMDPDHRLLLRNTKPLLQSRNTAVSGGGGEGRKWQINK